MFKKDGDNALSLIGTQITLANEYLLREAETIKHSKCFESNHLLLSNSDDSKIFKEMFPDLDIAKVRLSVWHISLKDLLLDNIKNVAVTFKFTESTRQQVKETV